VRDTTKKRKPTGITGPVRVDLVPGHTSVKFQMVQFPGSKSEIEAAIVRAFLAAEQGVLLAPLLDVRPNPECGFDFTDFAATIPTYVELMEIAPLEGTGGSYATAPGSYRTYEFADFILGKIIKKSTRYGTTPKRRLILLTYVTDWRFILSGTALALVQYWTLVRPHVFSEIYAFKPVSRNEGIPHRIYPTPRAHWRGFDPELYRDSVTHNVDPRTIRSASDDGV
jgi:hypothetical protein